MGKTSRSNGRTPRPLRRLLNLLRRFSSLSVILGELPVEPAARTVFPVVIEPNDVIIEVGARMGDGTRVLANLGRQVYAFEPSRESFLLLKAFTNKIGNVEAYNVAVGSHRGTAMLQKDRSFSGVASLQEVADVHYSKSQPVRMVTLDGIKYEQPPTSLVVDCEGYELEVLRGAERLLPTLTKVLVETHIMADGTTTTERVISHLGRFFSKLEINQAGNERWVIARKPRNVVSSPS